MTHRYANSIKFDRRIVKGVENRPYLIITARQGRHSVGYVEARWDQRDAYVSFVSVSGLYRRRGIGARLIRRLVYASRRASKVAVWADVGVSNAASIGMFSALGFTRIARGIGSPDMFKLALTDAGRGVGTKGASKPC